MGPGSPVDQAGYEVCEFDLCFGVLIDQGTVFGLLASHLAEQVQDEPRPLDDPYRSQIAQILSKAQLSPDSVSGTAFSPHLISSCFPVDSSGYQNVYHKPLEQRRPT